MKVSEFIAVAIFLAVSVNFLNFILGGTKQQAAKLAAWPADSTAIVQAGIKQGFTPVGNVVFTCCSPCPARGILLRKQIGMDDGVAVFRYWAQVLSPSGILMAKDEYLAMDGDTILVHLDNVRGGITIAPK